MTACAPKRCGGLAAGLGQQLARADGVGRQLRAGRCHRVDAGQRCAVAQRLGQPLEHRPPALAAGDDGKAAMRGGGGEGGFGQAADRHAGAFAQREQARVAEAADQHRIAAAAPCVRATAQASSTACCATAWLASEAM